MKALIATVLLFFGLTTMSLAAETRDYKVVRGDTLWQIAQRHGLKLTDLLDSEINPVLAKRAAERGNADLLYAGETIAVPIAGKAIVSTSPQLSTAARNAKKIALPAAQLKKGETKTEAKASALVPFVQRTSSLGKTGARVTASPENLENESAGWPSTPKTYFGKLGQALKNVPAAAVLFGACITTLALALWLLATDSSMESTKLKPAVKYEAPTPSSEQLISLFRDAKASDLAAALNGDLTTDHRGNKILAKNFPNFMRNRAHLSDVRVKDLFSGHIIPRAAPRLAAA